MRIEFPTEKVKEEVRKEQGNDVLQTIMGNKKIFLFLFIGFTLLSLVVSFWLSRSKSSTKEFFQVEQSLMEIANGEEIDANTVAQFSSQIKSYPELAGKLGDILAQYHLEENNMLEAEHHANQAFKRTEFVKSHYTDFSKTSLVIENREYQQALEEAKQLKETMLDEGSLGDTDFGGLLFGFNMIRIAFLEKLLENPAGELAQIQEIKRYFHLSDERDVESILPEKIGKALVEHFSDQNTSLIEYFQEREAILSAS